MRQITKKLLCLVLAVGIVFSFALTTASPAFAAEGPSVGLLGEMQPDAGETVGDEETNPAGQAQTVPEQEKPALLEAAEEAEDQEGSAQEIASGAADISIEELLEVAKTNGMKAAEMLNEVADASLFDEGVKQVLALYYAEEELYAQQLAAFEANIKQTELAQAFSVAAEERQTDELELGYVPGEVIVAFKEDVSVPEAAAILEEFDGTYSEEIETVADENLALADISLSQTVEEAVAEFEADPNVEYAQPNYIYTLVNAEVEEEPEVALEVGSEATIAATSNDPMEQWYLSKIGVQAAWDITKTASAAGPVLVSVIDTGVDLTHPDLKNNIRAAACYDVVEDKALDAGMLGDKDGHGTHVAGIIGAEANNSIGIAGVASGTGNGGTWNNMIEMMCLNVFTFKTDANNKTYASGASGTNLIKAIERSVGAGAKVINMSVGFNSPHVAEDAALKAACDAAKAAGVTVVCASGNSGTNEYRVLSDYDSTISVIGTVNYSSVYANGRYTGVGPSNYGAAKDISAPGQGLNSTVTRNTGAQRGFSSGYAKMTGTSMASPVVAGVVAMMYYMNPSITPAQVKTKITGTATDLYTNGRDDQTAYGNVNALNALRSQMTAVVLEPASLTLEKGATKKITAKVTPAGSAQNVYFNSSNAGVATVSGDGTVTAVSSGTAYIYAQSDFGKRTRLVVTVKNPPPPLDPIDAFVTRLYTLVMGVDEAPEDGVRDWGKALRNGATGTQVAYGFFFSPQYTGQNTSDTQYVQTLYQTLLNRTASGSDIAAWVDPLDNGMSREHIFGGLANSPEFAALCKSAGIVQGSYKSSQPRDQKYDITAFVSRLYKLCLGRQPDADGLNSWSEALLNGAEGAKVAYGFFFSNEMTSRRLGNQEYVEILYRVLLNRDPANDRAGFISWVAALDTGSSALQIFGGFVYSPEFTQLCADYGIVRGTF